MRAYGKVLEAVQQLGPFPAGLVLHSFAGPAEMVAPLAKVISAPRPCKELATCHTGHLRASMHQVLVASSSCPKLRLLLTIQAVAWGRPIYTEGFQHSHVFWLSAVHAAA